MEDTQRSQPISTKLQWIAEQAASYPERIFTSLANLIDVDLLREAFRLTRKDEATGLDGVTEDEGGPLGAVMQVEPRRSKQ
jgi:hypothetical protein